MNGITEYAVCRTGAGFTCIFDIPASVSMNALSAFTVAPDVVGHLLPVQFAYSISAHSVSDVTDERDRHNDQGNTVSTRLVNLVLGIGL